MLKFCFYQIEPTSSISDIITFFFQNEKNIYFFIMIIIKIVCGYFLSIKSIYIFFYYFSMERWPLKSVIFIALVKDLFFDTLKTFINVLRKSHFSWTWLKKTPVFFITQNSIKRSKFENNKIFYWTSMYSEQTLRSPKY